AGERRRREVAWCPRTFLQVPRVDVTRRAGEKDEDAVLRGVTQRDAGRRRRRLQQPRTEHVGEVRRDDSRAGDSEKVATREAVAVDGEPARLVARRALDLRFGKFRSAHDWPQSNRNSSELSSANCRSSAFVASVPLFR